MEWAVRFFFFWCFSGLLVTFFFFFCRIFSHRPGESQGGRVRLGGPGTGRAASHRAASCVAKSDRTSKIAGAHRGAGDGKQKRKGRKPFTCSA